MKRPAAACKKPGCAGLVRDGVCSVCGPLRRQMQRAVDERRGSAASRGYDRRWQRVRSIYLRAHPLCADCMAERRVTAATEVHHITALRDGGTHDDANLMALCKMHHSRRTAAGE